MSAGWSCLQPSPVLSPERGDMIKRLKILICIIVFEIFYFAVFIG